MTNILSKLASAVVDKVRSDLEIKVTSYKWELLDDGDYMLISISSSNSSLCINDPDKYASEISNFDFKKNGIHGWMVVLLNDKVVVDSVFSPL